MEQQFWTKSIFLFFYSVIDDDKDLKYSQNIQISIFCILYYIENNLAHCELFMDVLNYFLFPIKCCP